MKLSDLFIIWKLIFKKPFPLLFAIALLSLHILLASTILGYTRSLLGVYESITDIKDGIVVSSLALSPFTSIVDSRELEARIGDLAGLEVEYYMITFAFIYDNIVFIKSADIPDHCIALSKEIANSLSLNEGDIVPLYSIFTSRVILLRVCSIIDSAFSLISYQRCIEIRGVRPGVYSFAVIKSSDPETLRRVYERLGVQVGGVRLLTRGLILLQRIGDKRVARFYEDISVAYLNRMGLHRDLIVYLGYGLMIASMVSASMIGVALLLAFKNEVKVLLRQGLPRSSVLMLPICVFLVSLLISNAITYFALSIGAHPHLSILVFGLRPIITIWDQLFLNLISLVVVLLGMMREYRWFVENQ